MHIGKYNFKSRTASFRIGIDKDRVGAVPSSLKAMLCCSTVLILLEFPRKPNYACLILE